ncbi:MAG: TraB/GumN family protein, partial [Desulfobacterales bacterium]
RLGFNPLYGIDMHYYGKARTDGKKIGFLESVEFQLDLLGKMNTHDQNAFLNQTLKDLEVAAQMASDMMRYWQTGDSKNLYKLLFKSFEGYPEIQDRLLVQRNKDWAIKIAQMLKETNQVLVIVGAGHLIGPNSVVELLKQKGYSVKQR